jgi:large subunit ribosomal protein L36
MTALLQTVRSAASTTKSLASSMRALALAARPTTTTTTMTTLPAVQTRCLSQAALSGPRTTLSSGAGAAAPAVQSGVAVFQKQQARGMKVRSAIKKRCEHCKVSERTSEAVSWMGACVADFTLFAGRPKESKQAAQRLPLHCVPGEPEA